MGPQHVKAALGKKVRGKINQLYGNATKRAPALPITIVNDLILV